MKHTMRPGFVSGSFLNDDGLRKRIRRFCGLDPDAPAKMQAYRSDESYWPHIVRRWRSGSRM